MTRQGERDREKEKESNRDRRKKERKKSIVSRADNKTGFVKR